MVVNMCPRCGHTFPEGGGCACASGGSATAMPAPLPPPETRKTGSSPRPTNASTAQTLDIRPLLRLPQSVRLEGTVRSAVSGEPLPSDRPAWARTLEALGYLPVIALILWVGAMAIAMRLVAAMITRRVGHGGGVLGTARTSISLVDRMRSGRRPLPVTVLEVDTPDGSRMVRAAVDPATLNLGSGDHVVVFARGCSAGADLATKVEVPRRGVSYPVRLATPGMLAGALCAGFLLLVLLSVMSAQ